MLIFGIFKNISNMLIWQCSIRAPDWDVISHTSLSVDFDVHAACECGVGSPKICHFLCGIHVSPNFSHLSTLIVCHSFFLFVISFFLFPSVFILLHLIFFHLVLFRDVSKHCWQRWSCIGFCPTCGHRCRCPDGLCKDSRRCTYTGDGVTFRRGGLDCGGLKVKIRRSLQSSSVQRYVLRWSQRNHVWPAW